MDLSFSAEEIEFRDHVRAWIAEAMPPHIRDKAEVDAHFEHDEIMQWHRILYRKGWIAPHWPKEYGGAALDVTRRFILTEEHELAGTPPLSPFGLSVVGPLRIQFGSVAQVRRNFRTILWG